MVQGDQNAPIQFVVGKRIVGACGVAVAVDERVVPHVLVAQPACLQDRTRGALKFDTFRTSIEKALVVGVVWITADELRACARGLGEWRLPKWA